MLYVSDGALEHCAPTKRPITVVCPSVWIHYVIGGRGYYNGRPVGAGEAFIVYKNDVCHYAPDPEDPWTYVWIRLEGKDDEGLLVRSDLPSTSGVFSFDFSERLEQLGATLLGEEYAEESNRTYREAVARVFLSLHSKDEDVPPCPWDERWVLRAKEYVAQNYHRGIRVEELARALAVDRKYLRNLFVKYTGVSTKAYLDAYRMERAQELLSLGHTSIGIVALSVGYADPLAFSKAFRRRFGMSATQYRASLSPASREKADATPEPSSSRNSNDT